MSESKKGTADRVPFYINREIKNYFSSGWIANLGVVPLLLFSALRFFPDFFFLLALLFFVTLVFETILELLTVIYSRLKLLTLRPNVKALVTVLVIIAHCDINAASHGSTHKQILLSKGEHFEIDATQLGHFSIGNKEVLAARILKKSDKLLIKGKKSGYSELRIWSKSKTQKAYHVYVLSKKHQLSLANIQQTLSSINLQSSLRGLMVLAQGEVSELHQYKIVKSLIQSNPKNLISNLIMADELKNHLIGEIYFNLYNNNYIGVSCQPQGIQIFCHYQESESSNKKIIQTLKKRFLVQFTPKQFGRKANYKIKVKLIQIEKMNGEEFSFGLDGIAGAVGELFATGGLKAIIFRNQWFLKSHKIHLSTLSETQALLKVGANTHMELGHSIPFQTQNSENQAANLNWKFAGLSLDIKLKKEGNQLQLKYNTEFTRPDEEGISGSKQSSIIHIVKDRPIQLFEIAYRAIGDAQKAMPWLNKAPILGELFKSKSNKQTYKKIQGIVLLEEED